MKTRTLAAVGIRAWDIFSYNGITYRATKDASKFGMSEVRIPCTTHHDSKTLQMLEAKSMELILHKAARLPVVIDEELQERINTMNELIELLVKVRSHPAMIRRQSKASGKTVEEVKEQINAELQDVRNRLALIQA